MFMKGLSPERTIWVGTHVLWRLISENDTSTTDGFTQINPFPFVLETKVATTCLNSATFSATALSGWMTVNGPNNSGALQFWTHGSPWCCPLVQSDHSALV